MSRSKYKRKGRAKFLQVEGYAFQSAAFRSMTVYSRAAYLEVKWRFDGLNNGRIGFGCRELAEALGCTKDTANRCFVELEEKGFIAKTKSSGFNVKNRRATEWRLTEYECGGQLATKDFMKWKPEEKNTVRQEGRTVRQEGHSERKQGEKYADSPARGTVEPISTVSQSGTRDTYSITIGGRANAA